MRAVVISLIAAVAPFVLSAQSTTVTTGGFIGRIIDTNGMPLPSARVVFQRMPKWLGISPAHRRMSLAPGEVVYSTIAATDSQGRYSVAGMPTGTYNYCVVLPGYLDPCRWAYGLTAISQAGPAISLPDLVLKQGAIISITIQDPANRVGNWNMTAPGFAVGVFSPTGGYFGASFIAQSTGRLSFQVTVPLDQTVDLWLHSSKFTIVDESGIAIPAQGLRQTLPQAAAQSRTFTVTGLR